MARATRKVALQVRIAPSRSVVIDGRAREAGELVEVSAEDGRTLIADGYAVDPAAAVTSADAGTARAVFDGDDREVEHDASGRRRITPRMMAEYPEDEERGR